MAVNIRLGALNKALGRSNTTSNRNADGSPKAPKFKGIRTNTGTLKPQYETTFNPIENTYDSRAVDALRGEALRDPAEQSTWRKLQQEQINRQAGGIGAQLEANQRSALDRMAMTGGVGAGAAERMAQQGVGQGLAAQQGIFGMGLQADMVDEQNRLASLQGLNQIELGVAGQDLGVQQFNSQGQLSNDQFNINNTLRDIQAGRDFSMNKYNKQMEEWAAKNVAEATPSGGGGKK